MDVGTERQMMLGMGGGMGEFSAGVQVPLCGRGQWGEGGEGGEGGATTGPCSGPFISSKPPRVHPRCWDVLIRFQRTHWGALNLLVRPEEDSGVWVTGGCLESRLARFQISLVASVPRITRSGSFSQTGKPQREEIFQIKPKE